jgi:exopolysaccharide biosynthesis polyprenyl glycosylphosphotransferase
MRVLVDMNSNGLLRKHWFQVSVHFLLDAAIFVLCYVVGAFVVFSTWFNEDAWPVLRTYWPSFAIAGVTFSSVVYITGLYSSQSLHRSAFRRFFILFCCVGFAALVFLGLAYITTARPLGRGYMAVSTSSFLLLALLHHIYLVFSLKMERERVAYIVTSAFDEGETHIFSDIGLKHLDFVGVVAGLGYEPTAKARVLGRVEELSDIVARERIDRVLITGRTAANSSLAKVFCKLRYSGVTVMPLVSLCEELDQYVPLELVTPEWLLGASGEPHLLYIRKVKRLFDIVVSSLGLILGAPIVAIAALLVKMTSKGPAFFRQVRSGRFGKPFNMVKLRTMCADAEKNGAQWAQGGKNGSRDPRVTLVGGFLRRFRIDEIPQLWNVLRGDMSFVGPRPERPEMIANLAKDIPYYEERMMVQPGITGWAQVNYPYGATVLDARRKLEYDLYYLKNMGLFLDVFILLDTVRTVIFGADRSRRRRVAVDVMDRLEALRLSESKAGRTVAQVVSENAA